MSLKTNAVITSTPTNSCPCGKKTTAPATTPRVPTNVTVLGLIPQRRNRLPSGAQTLVQNWRNLSSMAGSGYRFSSAAQTSATAVGAPATDQTVSSTSSCRVSPPAPRTSDDPGHQSHGATECC